MLIKLRFIGLLLILFLNTSIFGKNYNQMSFSELEQELTTVTNIVYNNELWLFPTLSGIPSLQPREEGISLYIDNLKFNSYNLNKHYILQVIDELRRFSYDRKQQIKNTSIPQLKEYINHHPNNPNNPLNPLNPLNPFDPNIDPSKPGPEPSGATSCHSRGKGDFRVGTGRLQYRCIYYGSGQLHQEIPYVNNKRQGTEMIYYENGNLRGKNDYWDDYTTILRSFDKNGKLLCKKFDRGTYLGRCN